MKPTPRHLGKLAPLWLLAALLLTACTEIVVIEDSQAPTPVTPTPVPTATPLPYDATVGARILARGYLLVGIRYDLQPFGYIEDGEVAGFGVDMGHELASRWLGDPQAVQFRQVRTDTATEHLQAGDVDLVITALTHTQAGEDGADFSLPYFLDGQAILVRAADAAANGGTIAGPANLEGRPVGVVLWNDAEDALWAAVEFTPTIQVYTRFDEAVDALSWGSVDAVADLRHRLFWGTRLFPESAIVGQYTSLPVAIAYPENDPFFADLVNLTFQEMVADGTYAELYGRYFAPEYPPPVERWPGEELPTLDDTPETFIPPNTIAAIQARGRLSVALVDHAPFAYLDEEGAAVGYEVSLVRQLANRWLGDATAVDFTTVPLETGMQMLHTGRADLLIGGLTHTRAAEMEIDFCLTTYVAGEGLMIQAGTAITSVASLDGQPVAVVRGSGSDEVLRAAAQDAGVSVTVLPQSNLETAVAMLQEGRVVAVAGERADLLGPAYATPGLGVLPLRLTQVPLALGLPAGDSAFRDLVNMTLLAMKADGQFGTIYNTWFDDTAPALESWPGAPYRSLRLGRVEEAP